MRLGILASVLLVFVWVGAAGAADSVVADRIRALEDTLAESWLAHVDISGAIEVEAGYAKDYDDIKSSDIDLTNVEVGIDVGVNEWVSGFALLKWEADGGEGGYVDEGGIALGNLETLHYVLNVGKLYVPFGVFETAMISDPLTLELGEVREGAVSAEFAAAGFYGAAFVFNSDVNKSGEEDDMLDSWGISLGYQLEAGGVNVDLTAGYISNLTASGGFAETLDVVDEFTAGGAFSAVVAIADFTVVAEYVGALDDDYLDDNDADPAAWNVEVAYGFEVNEHEAGVAIGYQGSDDAAFLGLPEERWLASVNYELTADLGIALELTKDEDYSADEGGSGQSAESVLCQLVLEF